MRPRGRAVTEYSLTFAACRDLGHAWMYRSWKHLVREIICSNCGTVRRDGLHEWRVRKRSYRYPDGYLAGGSFMRIEGAIDARRRLSRLAQNRKIRWAGEEVRRHLSIA